MLEYFEEHITYTKRSEIVKIKNVKRYYKQVQTLPGHLLTACLLSICEGLVIHVCLRYKNWTEFQSLLFVWSNVYHKVDPGGITVGTHLTFPLNTNWAKPVLKGMCSCGKRGGGCCHVLPCKCHIYNLSKTNRTSFLSFLCNSWFKIINQSMQLISDRGNAFSVKRFR